MSQHTPQRVEFFLPMEPPTATAQQKRYVERRGRVLAYNPPKVNEARARYLAALFPHKPPAPLPPPLRLTVAFHFTPKRGTHAGQYKTTRPDTDNLIKLFKDCLTELQFFQDDAHVAVETVAKIYDTTPGVYVELQTIPGA